MGRYFLKMLLSGWLGSIVCDRDFLNEWEIIRQFGIFFYVFSILFGTLIIALHTLSHTANVLTAQSPALMYKSFVIHYTEFRYFENSCILYGSMYTAQAAWLSLKTLSAVMPFPLRIYREHHAAHRVNPLVLNIEFKRIDVVGCAFERAVVAVVEEGKRFDLHLGFGVGKLDDRRICRLGNRHHEVAYSAPLGHRKADVDVVDLLRLVVLRKIVQGYDVLAEAEILEAAQLAVDINREVKLVFDEPLLLRRRHAEKLFQLGFIDCKVFLEYVGPVSERVVERVGVHDKRDAEPLGQRAVGGIMLSVSEALVNPVIITVAEHVAFRTAPKGYFIPEYRPAVILPRDIRLHHRVYHVVGFIADEVPDGVLDKANFVVVLECANRLGFAQKGLRDFLADVVGDIVPRQIFQSEVEYQQRRDYPNHIRDDVVDDALAVGAPEMKLDDEQQRPYQKRYREKHKGLYPHIPLVFSVHFTVPPEILFLCVTGRRAVLSSDKTQDR